MNATAPHADGGWRAQAACLYEDSELFYPIGVTGPAYDQAERAKAVCRRCEVRERCLEWALDTRQDDGVWGGLSADERRTLRLRGRAPTAPRTVTVDRRREALRLLRARAPEAVSAADAAAELGCSDDLARRALAALVSYGHAVRVGWGLYTADGA